MIIIKFKIFLQKYLSGDVVGRNVENQDVEVLLSSLPCPTSCIHYETVNSEIQELRTQNKSLMQKIDELQKKNEFYEKTICPSKHMCMYYYVYP